jgi:hypothetical protein
MPTMSTLIRPNCRRIPGERIGAALALALTLTVPAALLAQAGQGRGGGAAAPASAKNAAPVDLTGYWVSIVTEDWIERMAPDSPPSGTGARGGRGIFPGGGGAEPAATRPANADPCRVYAAGGSLRVPGRLNITWADDNTLKVDMDSGSQTRVLHFGAAQPPSSERSSQGYSVATWETGRGGGGFGGGRGGGGGGARAGGAPAGPTWANLKVVTTNMNGGYLLSSRSTYSEDAVLTENFTTHQDFGTDYFTVTAIIEDGPTTRITSSTFKREPNGSKFTPTGCDIVR